ncbi:MAG: GIY-YIG nuclease family protein [Patescibacteria group bacterium]|nr:GIY-YIG nuclease family protein [Patescibacteria group bacterium]
MANDYYIYFLTNQNNKVIYIGVTNNLKRRVYEHRIELIDGFTKKYKCKKLVYFEGTKSIISALEREKQLKKWRREKKDDLVNQLNPDWKDLYESI